MSYLRTTHFFFWRHAAFNKSVSAFFLPSEYNFMYIRIIFIYTLPDVSSRSCYCQTRWTKMPNWNLTYKI